MFSVILFLGHFIILCNRARGQGNPCRVSYMTINEKVPYCGVSSWVEWDCLNTCTGLSTQMDTITHVRVFCCSTSDCIAECHFPKGHGEETQYCGNVCPPFFTSSPQSTPSTAPLSTTTSTKPTSSSTTTTQPTAAPSGNQQGNGVGNGIITAPTTPSTSAGTVGHIATAPNGHNNGQTIASALLTTTFTPNSPQTTPKSSVSTIGQAQTQNGVSSIVTVQTVSTSATTQRALAISASISTTSKAHMLSTSKFQNVVVNVDTTQTLVTPKAPTTLAPAGQSNSISSKNSEGGAEKTCPLGPWKLHDNYDLSGR